MRTALTLAAPAQIAPARAAAIVWDADPDRSRAEPADFDAPPAVTAHGGRRRIGWNAAPDAVADLNAFPGGSFNADVFPRARDVDLRRALTGRTRRRIARRRAFFRPARRRRRPLRRCDSMAALQFLHGYP